jgi:hypothetical protein
LSKVEQRLQWRREKVRELSIKGHGQRHAILALRKVLIIVFSRASAATAVAATALPPPSSVPIIGSYFVMNKRITSQSSLYALPPLLKVSRVVASE